MAVSLPWRPVPVPPVESQLRLHLLLTQDQLRTVVLNFPTFSITSPASGDTLRFNGTDWINSAFLQNTGTAVIISSGPVGSFSPVLRVGGSIVMPSTLRFEWYDAGGAVSRGSIFVNNTPRMGFDIGGTDTVQLTATVLSPVTTGAVHLGSSSLRWGEIHSVGPTGVGANTQANVGLYLGYTVTTIGTAFGYGILSDPIGDTTITGNLRALGARVRTTASSYTMTSGYGVFVLDASKGAGSTITNLYGIWVDSQTQGATNWAIKTNTGQVELGDNLALFGTGSYGGGDKVVFIKNATTVPSSNPTGGGVLYTEAGALKFRGSGGTVTTIAAA